MVDTTILLEPTKRRERIRVVNDAIPGIILLTTGLGAIVAQGLTREPMPYIDVIVGALVVRYAVTELKGHHPSRRVSWFDILGGIVIIIDAINQYKPWKHFQPAHLLFLVGVLTIARAILAEKIPKLRRAVIGHEKLFVRTTPLRALSLEWSDIVRIAWSDTTLEFVTGRRSTRLSLRRVENRLEVIHAILDAGREHGIDVVEAT